jgi:hypothetical protein
MYEGEPSLVTAPQRQAKALHGGGWPRQQSNRLSAVAPSCKQRRDKQVFVVVVVAHFG